MGTGGAGSGGRASGGAGGARAGSGGAAAGGAARPRRAGGVVASGPIKVLIWNNALTYGHQSRITAIPYLQARQAERRPQLRCPLRPHAVAARGTGRHFVRSVRLHGRRARRLRRRLLPEHHGQHAGSRRAGDTHRQALIDFIKKGRGFVGTHSATDTYQGTAWPWYVDFIGANFKDHSTAGTSGTARYASNVAHPILTAAGSPNPWNRTEEWYTFTRDPTTSAIGGVTILLTCTDTVMTAERPSAWVHEMPADPSAPRAGRLFYTAFGHYASAFQEKAVMDLIVAGIKWAAYRL